jgi:hypothetical protein
VTERFFVRGASIVQLPRMEHGQNTDFIVPVESVFHPLPDCIYSRMLNRAALLVLSMVVSS